MKLKILGSAACEGIPAIFCGCATCMAARANGGKDIRTRAAYQLSERIRVDLGPDALIHEQKYQLKSENLRHLIMTHSHEDHLDAHLLDYRREGYSAVPAGNTLTIYGNQGVKANIDSILPLPWEKYGMQFVETTSFQPIEVPEEDMTIYPLAANHMPTELPNIYVIRLGKKHLAIFNDTGFPREPNWEWLAKQNFVLDLLIMDCTCGIHINSDTNHMGGITPIRVRDELRKLGRIDDHTKVYVNHFSHNGHNLHADLEAYYNPQGIQVGYDGLETEY